MKGEKCSTAAMPDRALDALFHYLEGDEGVRAEAQRILFLRARACPQLRIFSQNDLICHQTFRRDAQVLEKAGYRVQTELPSMADLCIYLGTKQRDENLANFARGLRCLRPGGLFVCALANELGAARFEKELARLGELALTYAKNHARVFGIRCTEEILASETLQAWEDRGAPIKVPGTDLYSQPGIFAWDKIDRGSELLRGHIPEGLTGVAADLGSGYGYLAARVLESSPQLRELDLYEAEKLGLEASKRSFAELKTTTSIRYLWHDVTEGLPRADYDVIVMNPPFHTGRQTSFALGEKFARVAAASLKQGGELYMVANLHLPYERVLEAEFSRSEQLAARIGFKVLKATK